MNTQSEKEKVLLHAVLVFFPKNGRVPLAIKLKNIGKGKLNSCGGSIEKGESAVQAAVRETQEEQHVHISPVHLEKCAEMLFHNITKEGIPFDCKVIVFLASKYEGSLIPSKDFGKWKDYFIDDLPVNMLMPADPFWLPPVLLGKKIKGEAWYGPKQEYLLRPVRIRKVKSFS